MSINDKVGYGAVNQKNYGIIMEESTQDNTEDDTQESTQDSTEVSA